LGLAGRVLAAIADAVVAVDRDGTICCWTPATERLVGVPAAKAIGQQVTSIFPGLVRNDPIEVTTLGGAEKLDSIHSLGKSGLLFALSTTPLRDEHGSVAGTVALVRPMDGWLDPDERAERPKRQWHRTLRAIVQELVEGAAEDPSGIDAPEALARMLVARANKLIPGAECVLAIVPWDERERLRVVAGAGPWAERQVGAEWPQTGTLAGRSLQDGRALESARLCELGEPIRELAESCVHSGRFVPLQSACPLPDGRHTLGVLAFYRTTRTYFTPYERRLIAEFSRLVTLSLERPHVLRSVCETLARLGNGVDVAFELAMTLDASEVAGSVVRQAAESVEAGRTEPPRGPAGRLAQRFGLVRRVAPQPRPPLEADGSRPSKSHCPRVESRPVADGLPEQVLNALADAVIAIDRDGQVIVWNPAAERLLGILADEVLGQPLPEVGISMGKLLVGRRRRVTLRRRNGGELPTTVTTTTLPGQHGWMVLLVNDMTPWIGPASTNMTGADALIDRASGAANPAHSDVDEDQVVRLNWTAGNSVETRMLGFLALLLPARERMRFVVEATANLGFCDSLLQRIGFLLAMAIGTPRLAFMLRRRPSAES
jgi:PAS domain S-box-containing protein